MVRDQINLSLLVKQDFISKIVDVIPLPWGRGLHGAELKTLSSGHVSIVLLAVVARLLRCPLSRLQVDGIGAKEELDVRERCSRLQLHVPLEVGCPVLALLELVDEIMHQVCPEGYLSLWVVECKAYVDKSLSHSCFQSRIRVLGFLL